MFVVLALSSSVMAQDFNPTLQQRTAPNPETYGTASEVAISIPDFEFTPFSAASNTVQWLDGRWVSTPFGQLRAGLHLPAGAAITRMELQACDTNATELGILTLAERPNSTGSGNQLAAVFASAMTGCTLVPVTLSAPHTVNNAINSYYLAWTSGNATDGTVRIQAARVFYQLQVSPPPGTATFSDVPTTHLFD